MSDAREFLSRTLHDLRNPLSSVLGYGELLLELQATPEAQGYAALVVSKARLMTRLMEMAGDLAWAQEGRQPVLVPEPCDLVRLAQEAVKSVLADFPELKIRWEGCASLPLSGDRPKLRKILHALISNAALHGRNSPEVCLTLSSGGSFCRFAVEDSGPGFPEDVLKNLGSPYNKSPGSPGSGLGLAWCRLLAQAHGGRLEAENTFPGCRVTLTLPSA